VPTITSPKPGRPWTGQKSIGSVPRMKYSV
jgi:hypothetical protein